MLTMAVAVSDFAVFEEDDLVRVVAGPFASFIGVVEEVAEVRARLKPDALGMPCTSSGVSTSPVTIVAVQRESSENWNR